MDNKKLGIIILVVGIVLASIILVIKLKEDMIINQFIMQEGTCFLKDGTCLHNDRFMIGYIIGWFISAIMISLGLYLLIFEKSQKAIISTLEKHKHMQIEGEKFDILLKGLSEDERKIIKAVKDQDGITQQTLRLRTDLHKSKLSILLDGLEKKGLIARKVKGKTKQVFIKIGL
jgi:DNA-binding MarR family transcriptional regulator